MEYIATMLSASDIIFHPWFLKFHKDDDEKNQAHLNKIHDHEREDAAHVKYRIECAEIHFFKIWGKYFFWWVLLSKFFINVEVIEQI